MVSCPEDEVAVAAFALLEPHTRHAIIPAYILLLCADETHEIFLVVS